VADAAAVCALKDALRGQPGVDDVIDAPTPEQMVAGCQSLARAGGRPTDEPTGCR